MSGVIRLPEGQKRFTVDEVFRLVADANGHAVVNVFVEVQEDEAGGEYHPDGGKVTVSKAPTIAGILAPFAYAHDFPAACERHGIHPCDPMTAHSTSYTGTPEQNIRYTITVEELTTYAEARGLSVETAAKPKKKAGRKPGAQKANLGRILDALEEWAVADGRDFNRHAMPGPRGESADDEGSFHWLCAKLYRQDFMKTPRAFEEHRAGVCAIEVYAKPTDFYRQALPHIAQKLGVVLNVQIAHERPESRVNTDAKPLAIVPM